jgi:membrane associated rhomboid family serine protease
MQVSRWQRIGLRRPPVATAVVFVVTAVTSVLGLVRPGVLAALERSPEGLHGDWWRSVTALFVQDGGVVGTVSNLAFLLVLGALAEQVLGARRWLVCYFGAGLAGELAGYAWQPTGAGNSVAVCGLAGLLVVALLAGERLPRLAPMAVLWWCGALLATRWGTGPLLAGIGGAVAVQAARPWAVTAGRLAAAAAVLAGVALAVATDLHGAALLAGVAIAAATRPWWPTPPLEGTARRPAPGCGGRPGGRGGWWPR